MSIFKISTVQNMLLNATLLPRSLHPNQPLEMPLLIKKPILNAPSTAALSIRLNEKRRTPKHLVKLSRQL